MSLTAAYSEAAPRRPTDTTILLLIVWLATVISHGLTGAGLSTDDAMRLVQARDLLAGQSWFDLTQYRLNPPDGVAMHWSRLIDLPLAALIRLGELTLPSALAERAAAVIWPAGLLLVFLGGITRLARVLADDSAARLALIFAVLTAPLLQHFRAGAIDHHNVQLVLLIWSLALIARPALTPRHASVAGALCGLSLAIGQELAPAIVAVAAVVALRWIVRGAAVRQSAAAFALTFTAATAALLAVTVPSSRYSVATCDALSVVHVTATVIGGVGLAALTAIPALNSIGRRLAAAGALGAATGAVMMLAFPACLGDPYAHLDPRVSSLWLSSVNEVRSFVSLLRDLPQDVLPHYGLAAIGLTLGVVRCRREQADRRWSWITGTAVLLVLSAVSLWQLRGAAAANAVAAALVPAALVRVLPAPAGGAVFLCLSRAALIAALLVNPLTLIAIGNASAYALEAVTNWRRPVVITDGPGTCTRAADYAPLARLPQGIVLGFIDAGPFVLMETPHSVLAAPYHRNVQGNAATLDIFLAVPSEAARLLAAHRVDYVAFCPGAPERYNYTAAAPRGLAAVLGRGEVPYFLEAVTLEGTNLAVYRRRP